MTKRHVNIGPLTSWRFFAAALVVFYHYTGSAFAAWPEWIQRFMSNGYQAVGFFFVLSGFVLVYTYHMDGSPSEMKTTPKQFWLARFARIYPVYALALLLALAPFLWTVYSRKSISAVNFGLTLGATPAVLQAWIPSTCLVWNGPAWSLSVEAFFYLFFPWLMFSMRRWTSSWMAVAASLLLAVGAAGLLHWIFPLFETGAPTPSESVAHHFFAYFPLFHLPTFLLGMALGMVYLSASRQDVNPLFYNALAIVSFGLVCALFCLHGRVRPILLSSTITVPIYGLLIYSSARCSGLLWTFLSHRWLVRLGDASYALYIIHAPVGWWFSVCLKRFSVQHALVYFMFYFVSVVAACLLIHKYFEMPLKDKILGKFGRPIAAVMSASQTVRAPHALF
jgi:peptidoglycan/LPS O-acetylase OafA/YrhL